MELFVLIKSLVIDLAVRHNNKLANRYRMGDEPLTDSSYPQNTPMASYCKAIKVILSAWLQSYSLPCLYGPAVPANCLNPL